VTAKGLVPLDKPLNNSKPAGTVFDQSPIALAEAPAKSTVTISVSLGAAPTPVPSLVGSTVDGATATLRAQGFTVGLITPKDGTTPKGQVISSKPAIGVKAPYGSAVQLTVGSGLVVVPTVVGKQLDAATQALIAAGLGAPITTSRYDSHPVGYVRYQNPDKGKVALGYQIQLTVSLGKPIVVTTPPTTPPASLAPTTPVTGTPVTPTTSGPPATTTPPVAPTTSAAVAPTP
jgi:eukaryotic-like serine/threonine-protein kinase